MAIVDHRGRPIRPRDLREEQAGPALTGVRTVWSNREIGEITPERMAAILRESEIPGDGAAERYVELAEVIEERDLHYLGVMQTRKRSVAQIGVMVEPVFDSADDVADAEMC